MAEFEDDAALVGFEDDLRFALLMVARGWSHTLLSVLAQCPGGAMFIVWSCGDGAEVNELALELAPESEVVPAIAWPNWFATCAMAATKVSDALREFLSVAVH